MQLQRPRILFSHLDINDNDGNIIKTNLLNIGSLGSISPVIWDGPDLISEVYDDMILYQLLMVDYFN